MMITTKNVRVAVSDENNALLETVVMSRDEFRTIERRLADDELEAFEAGDSVTVYLHFGASKHPHWRTVRVELTTDAVDGRLTESCEDTRTLPARIRALRDEAGVAGDEVMVIHCREALSGHLLTPHTIDALLEALRIPRKAFWQVAGGGDKVSMTLPNIIATVREVMS